MKMVEKESERERRLRSIYVALALPLPHQPYAGQRNGTFFSLFAAILNNE